MSVPDGVTVVDHVLLRRLVSILRDRETPHGVFRQTLDDAGMILEAEGDVARGDRHETDYLRAVSKRNAFIVRSTSSG